MHFLALSLCAASVHDDRHVLSLPPRLMWGWGPRVSGYCGSASIQTVALYYGNWLTQDAVRGVTGGHDGADQLLLGDEDGCCNSVAVARKLHLNVTAWPHASAPRPQHIAFAAWMAESIDSGEPVVFGVYMQTEDNPDLDHIVPLVGYVGPPGRPSKLLYNDLHSNKTLEADLASFPADRSECKRDLPWNERFAYCLPASVDYGYRVHGNHDPAGELLPSQLIVPDWYEPDYSAEDAKHETPRELRAAVLVSGLTAGERFVLLRYEHASAVPLSDFLRMGGWAARTDFVAPSHAWNVGVTFMSNTTQFFRCVHA